MSAPPEKRSARGQTERGNQDNLDSPKVTSSVVACQAPLLTKAEFFRALYGNAPTGYLTISHKRDASSRKTKDDPFLTESFPASKLTDAAAYAEKIGLDENVWFGLVLRRDCPADGKRGSSEDAALMPGFWLELDVKKGAFKSKDEILEFIKTLPRQPTIIVDSGNGFHPYWLFREPWVLEDKEDVAYAASLSRGWAALAKSKAKKAGASMDSVFDLARALRVPGTTNLKGGKRRPVTVVFSDGPRYNPSDFEEWAAPAEAAETDDKSAPTATFTFNRDAAKPAKLDILLTNNLRAAAAWKGKKPEFGSDSQADQSLADHCAAAGFSPQEIVDSLIARWREHRLRMKLRLSYFDPTIKNAMAYASRVQAGVTPIDEHDEDEDERPSKRGPKQSEQIIALAADVELWHTSKLVGYATVAMEDGHRENMQVQSKPFRNLLRNRFYDQARKTPANQALIDAVSLLDGQAIMDGPCYPAFIRVAESGGNVYLDLCDEHWQVVEISATGWRVTANPPVRFLRKPGMQALGVPVAGGSISALRRFVNATDDLFILVVAWLVGALSPNGPYLVLTLLGPQGSGKSFLARMLRMIIDPNVADLNSAPREERDLAVAAANAYALAIDNISRLPDWLSDALSKLSTTGGFKTRENYSDDREVVFERRVPILLTGISGVATRPDLLDRAAVVTLTPIRKAARLTERRLLAEFNDAAPLILGGLLDAVVAALAGRDKVTDQLPRMADFAEWVVAAEPALPWRPGAFLLAYEKNRAEAVEIALESDTLGESIPRFMTDRPEWSGSASQLLSTLDGLERGRRPIDWPRSPSDLSARLTRLEEAFASVGIEITRYYAHAKTRMIKIANANASTPDSRRHAKAWIETAENSLNKGGEQ
jgi:energy-coupling factor transporter ATP-binding protein EcfA2